MALLNINLFYNGYKIHISGNSLFTAASHRQEEKDEKNKQANINSLIYLQNLRW